MHKINLLALMVTYLLQSACGWVDSTGVQEAPLTTDISTDDPASQGNSPGINPSDGNTQIEPNQDDSVLSRSTIHFNENTASDFTLAETPTAQSSTLWHWDPPIQSGALHQCNSDENFDVQFAATSLEAACSEAENCEITFSQSVDEAGNTIFGVRIPPLDSPVGLEYRLVATEESENQTSHSVTICANSINEAPDAKDDIYYIMEGEALVLDSSANNLLSNDLDDNDVRNLPLAINTNTVVQPENADYFEIDRNGNLIYQARLLDANELLEGIVDRFSYSVSDGTHSSVATVTINVTTTNSVPVLIEQLPDIVLYAGTAVESYSTIDLSDFFIDKDETELFFSTSSDSLPPSGNLRLDRTGILTGFVTNDDIGDFYVTVIASDDQHSTAGSFTLSILPESQNRPPTVTDIKNRTYSQSFSYDISMFFSDPDGDQLSYTTDRLPSDVTLTGEGLLEGFPSSENLGRYLITVTATDGHGGQVSDRFRLSLK